MSRNAYVNQTDTGDGPKAENKDFVHQNHSVAIVDVEGEQVEREQWRGYYFPVSRDRLYREMNPVTQSIVKMLCEGISKSEIALKLDISPRQLRRRMGVATEDGDATLSNVLHTLQACADEDSVLEWPEQETFDIQGCAAPSERFLTAQEAA